eukprot:scaffold137241_cov42-Prasinocladus_malaysianus.AAC.1
MACQSMPPGLSCSAKPGANCSSARRTRTRSPLRAQLHPTNTRCPILLAGQRSVSKRRGYVMQSKATENETSQENEEIEANSEDRSDANMST